MGAVGDADVFCAVLPIVVPSSSADDGDDDGMVRNLSDDEVAALCAEAERSLSAKTAALAKTFGDKKGLVTLTEATFVLVCNVLQSNAKAFAEVVNYIEAVIEEQLTAAVGKVLQPKGAPRARALPLLSWCSTL